MRARAGGTSDTDSIDDEDQKPSRPRAAKVNRGLVVLVFILSGVVLLLLLGPSHEIHHSVPAVPAGDAGRFVSKNARKLPTARHVHDGDVGVADPAVRDFDDDFARAWIRNVDVVHD